MVTEIRSVTELISLSFDTEFVLSLSFCHCVQPHPRGGVSLEVRLDVTQTYNFAAGGEVSAVVRLEVSHASPGRRGGGSFEVRLEVTQTHNFPPGTGLVQRLG